jgi:(p)ppGpp synthase/HD superfamily hydrolase
MYSFKIEQAIRAATVLHQDQLRMGTVPLPYISHLIAVALILSAYTDDEDTIAAAFLHDTLEDTDYTEEELREDFGGPVAEIVLSLTEHKTDAKGNKLSWLEKKKAYARQLKQASQAAPLIAAADKLHNFKMVVEEYSDDHNRFLKDFGPRGEERIEAYQEIANAINSKLQSDIVPEFNQAFTDYKQFLINVEKTQNSF